MKLSLMEHTKTMAVAQPAEKMPEGIMDCNARAMWDQGHQGDDVVVAVIDTGYTTHPDLAGRIIGGRNFTTDHNGDPSTYLDNNFHGNHVAGTIAAVRGNNIGVMGVSPKVKLLIVKVLDSKGEGTPSQAIQGIDWAINWRGPNGEKVRIMNMSMGGKFDIEEMHNAIKRADAAGICVVCASGNIGDGNEETIEVNYPAYYPEAIAVGAYDMWGGVAAFSNTNNQIDLIAPGSNVLSTDHVGGYVYASGTSMAAPHVSGSLALIAGHLDKRFGRTAKGSELYEYLINYCTAPLDGIGKLAQGNGRLFNQVVNVTAPVKKVKASDVNFDEALAWFNSQGMMNTPAYWKTNAAAGKTVKGEFIREFIAKVYIVQGLKAQVDE